MCENSQWELEKEKIGNDKFRPELFLKSVLQRKFTSLHWNLCIQYLIATISFIMKKNEKLTE